MILLVFIFVPLGFIALVLLTVIALCRIARDADEWQQERRDGRTDEICAALLADELYGLPSCESRPHGSVR